MSTGTHESELNQVFNDQRLRCVMYVIDQVWVEREAMEYPLTERIIKASNPARVLVGSQILEESARVELAGDPFRRGKRILKLTRYRGSFVKPCPGTKPISVAD